MKQSRRKPTIVVETRGGTVVAVYGSKRSTNVVLVDWDEFYDQGRPGIPYTLDSPSEMPADTRSLVDQGVADKSRDEGISRR